MSYLSKIGSIENLREAFRNVASNKGRAGIDCVTIENFEERLEETLTKISGEILGGTYTFSPSLGIRRGSKRIISVMTVRDRVVAQAVNRVLQPVMEKIYSPVNYSYRQGRSAIQAAVHLENQIKQGRDWILRADIEGFFDTVRHPILQSLLEHLFPQDPAVDLIMDSMKPGIFIKNRRHETQIGIAQGSPLSPLLANLFLTPLDNYMVQEGWDPVRFSDDIAIAETSRERAQKAGQDIFTFLDEKLDLGLNSSKCKIVHISDGFEFLGFHYSPEGRRPSQKSIVRLNEKLVTILGDEAKMLAAVRGWEQYFLKHESNGGQGSCRDFLPTTDDLQAQSQPVEEPADPHDLETIMLGLFQGSSREFAVQRLDSMGRIYAQPVNSPLDRKAIGSHLKGDITIAIYMRGINGVKLACIDVDISPKIMHECQQDPDSIHQHRRAALEETARIKSALNQAGIEPLLEDSGYKGYHLWLFFKAPLHEKDVEKSLLHFLDKIGPPLPKTKREVFPRTCLDSQRGCDIKLPLGVHMKSRRKSHFLDENLQPVEDPVSILSRIKKIEAREWEDAISRPPSISVKEDSQPETLFKKCHVLGYLRSKAERDGHLGHFERWILLHTLGHLGEEGRQALHRVISYCDNYNAHYTDSQIEKMKPSPIGCTRIQEIMGKEIEFIPCVCNFKIPEHGYASPLLHIDHQATKDLSRRVR